MKKGQMVRADGARSFSSLAKKANPRRGKAWVEYACHFYDRFTPPCRLTTTELDVLFREFDPEYSGGVQGLHSRVVWMRRIRSASTTQGLNVDGRQAFDVYYIAQGEWRCEPTADAVMLARPLVKAHTFIETLATQERYYEESLPLEHLTKDEIKRLEQHASYTKQQLELFQMHIEVTVRQHQSLMHSMLGGDKQPELPEFEQEQNGD